MDTVFQSKPQALISYVMVGDDSYEASLSYARFLIENGADILELGMPFSDPAADGETILKAGLRAQASGTKMRDVFRFAKTLKASYDTPLVIMSYLNPIFQFGYDDFFKQAAEAGVEAVIIPDLPYEGIGEIKPFLEKYNIKSITMIALNTPSTRIEKLVKHASGFLYLVAIKGITGTQRVDAKALKPIVEEIKKVTKVPLVAGFGIRDIEDRKSLLGIVDGVVIASAFITLRENNQLSEIQSVLNF